MKVIYLGTPEFAVKPLKSIIESDKHEVVAVVTQPDKPVGRKAIITPPPVKKLATEYGIPVLQFEKIRNGGAEELGKFNADIMVTCAYGQILSQEIIDVCRYGIINIHASLLPKYRGAAPIQYAVINGEKTTGVTIMQTEAGIDTGDILAAYKTEIGETETAGELAERLSEIGASKICEVLTAIEEGKVEPQKQNNEIATVVKTIKKCDAALDFSNNYETVAHFINGMSPSPAAYAYIGNKSFKFYRAKAIGVGSGEGKYGEVIEADKRLLIACDGGAVDILEIQEEGGKRLSARDFLNGRKLKVGDLLTKEKC